MSENIECYLLSFHSFPLFDSRQGLSLARDLSNRLNGLGSWGSIICFCLTNTRIPSMCHHTQLFSCMFWAISLVPEAYTVGPSGEYRPWRNKQDRRSGRYDKAEELHVQCHSKLPKDVGFHGREHTKETMQSSLRQGERILPPFDYIRWIHFPERAVVNSVLLGCMTYIIWQQSECQFPTCLVLLV